MLHDIIASLQRRADELAKQYPELDRIRMQLEVPNFNVEDTALLLERTVTAEVALSATDNTADPVSYVFTYCYTWGFDLVGRRCHKCGKVCTLIERDQCGDCGGAAIVRAEFDWIEVTDCDTGKTLSFWALDVADAERQSEDVDFSQREDGDYHLDEEWTIVRADIQQDQRRED